MNPDNNNAFDNLPEAEVKTKGNFSIVWIIPIVAALIGGWLAYKAFTEKGPTITITFKSAEGLEAGKTKIKYKDVEVGQVTDITISDDISHVVLTAELQPDTRPYLRDDTRFWVVKARVAAGQVSGIGTLFSGAYIAMDPGSKGKKEKKFSGLETPPAVTMDDPGREFVLRAETLGSHDIGTPLYFRKIKAGQVIGYHLDDDGSGVDIRVFVYEPYDKFVRNNTRFWDASGIDMTLNAEGIKIDTESFVSMMLGGIAFETFDNLESNELAPPNQSFKLYASRRASEQEEYSEKQNYLMYFAGSVRGLKPGAPVEFRGIKVGEVIDLKLQYDPGQKEFRIPVLVEIEPERVDVLGETQEGRGIDDLIVAQGMRAQLEMGNLLTGSLYIELDFHPNAPPAEVDYSGPYPAFPTLPTPLERVAASLMEVLTKIEQVPFDQIGTNLDKSLQALNETLAETQQLAKAMDDSVAPAAEKMLSQTEKTMAEVERTLSGDSPLTSELRRALEELSEAARSFRIMADYLERHPDALIKGKEGH